ncbi:MAG: FtsX-like permease family protein [Solirubrobacteraceae bacterium]
MSSETATSKLQVNRTVSQNFRAAYDILVRPNNAQTPFERRHHLVDNGFLSGLFGGISLDQYHQIASIHGVSVAAPVANVGSFLLSATVFVPFPPSVHPSQRTVYRIATTWNVHRGLSRYPSAPSYVYYTPHQLTFTDVEAGTEKAGPAGQALDVCGGWYRSPEFRGSGVGHGNGEVRNPYAAALKPLQLSCASPSIAVAGNAARQGLSFLHRSQTAEPAGELGAYVNFSLPVLIAGVDPAAEQQLVGLGRAVTSGSYLQETGGLSRPHPGAGFTAGAAFVRTYPVLASINTFLDQEAQLRVEQLQPPAGASVPKLLASGDVPAALSRLGSRTVGRALVSPDEAWRSELSHFNSQVSAGLESNYWRVSPTTNAISRSGVVAPSIAKNDPSVWTDTSPTGESYGFSFAPPGANDVWYRRLRAFGASGSVRQIDGHQTFIKPYPALVGTFNPSRLRGFSPLSKVPLQTFYPPQASAGDAAARRALGASPLGPTTNLAGYLSQPPLLLTTIAGAVALDNGNGGSYTTSGGGSTQLNQAYSGASPAAPISSVQVRVSGVTGPDAVSLARIKAVAQQIAIDTGLRVDITAGSSPTTVPIGLVNGNFGQPALKLDQSWVKENVDSGIINALNNKELVLFVVLAVICALFVASATLANVRQRRREIAVLRTVGWPVRLIFSLIVGEAALVGLIAGVAGALLTLLLAVVGSLDVPTLRVALIVPVAVVLALVAALLPAWRATRIQPLEALQDPVWRSRRRQRVRTVTGLAVANVARVPGRSLLAFSTLALAVSTLALILGLNVAFHGAVAGNLLGNVVIVNVRDADLITTVLVVLVGAGSVADVLYVSLQERRAELGTLRAVGWTERDVFMLAMREGLLLGASGSVLGAVVGVVLVAILGGSATAVAGSAVLAALAGCAVTALAVLVPIRRIIRATPAQSLATAD